MVSKTANPPKLRNGHGRTATVLLSGAETSKINNWHAVSLPDGQLPDTKPNPDSRGGKALFSGCYIGGMVSWHDCLVGILLAFLIMRLLSSSVCRAADAGNDLIWVRIGFLETLPLKDYYQKAIASLALESLLTILGVDPVLIKGAESLNTEFFGWDMKLSRPDLIVRLNDGSILIIEFQSTANDHDLFRFQRYVMLVAEKILKQTKGLKTIPRIEVIVVYPATIGDHPHPHYPYEAHDARDCVTVTLTQVFLEYLFGMNETADKFQDILDTCDGNGVLSLSQIEMTEFFLSALGTTPEDHSKALEVTEKYLTVGRNLAEKARDPSILFMTICGVMAHKNIANPATIYKFMEGLLNMNFDDVKFMDGWTGGKYSLAINNNKLLTEMNFALTERNAALVEEKATAVAEFQAEKADWQAEKADWQAEKADWQAEKATLASIAVRSLHAENKSTEEISETLNLEEAEVLRILKSNGNGR
ncbi:MAG: hypothetical protein LBT40_09365 [Deltaproteobacteria bacterium]|jgi:hypothetical protein|nr:hypothetical protein [Deltaproteobacteria bacterium]